MECLKQAGQRHALRLGLDAIDLDIKLWHVGLVANEANAHAWRLHRCGLQRVGRLLERAVARARTVFEEQRIARALAKTEDRRRVQHEGKAFLDLGDLGLDIGGNLLGAAVALVEGLQDRKGNGIIRRIGLLCGVETGQSDHVGNTIRAERDVHHPLQHGIGALQRGTLGQLHAGDQIELVLGRNEATRHGVEHQPGAGQQHDIDCEYGNASPERARDGALVGV